MNLGNETEQVEFKKSTAELEKGIQAISGMLNKHGRGELFFGVDDSGNVIGQQISDSTIKEVALKIKEQIEPAIEPNIERLFTDDGVEYICVAFSGNESAYKAKGIYYIRTGTITTEMTTAQLKNRFQISDGKIQAVSTQEIDEMFNEVFGKREKSKYLKEALLEYQKRATITGYAVFIHHQDDEAIIYGVEQAIFAGYLQQGGQVNDGILISGMTIPGKEYLREMQSDSI